MAGGSCSSRTRPTFRHRTRTGRGATSIGPRTVTRAHDPYNGSVRSGLLTPPIALALALFALPANAADSSKLTVTSPLPVILGEADSIGVAIDSPETPDTEGRPLQLAVNVGQIDPPERVGPGKYRTTYHLPTTKYPQTAIV